MGFPDERLSADDEEDCLAMVQQQCRSFLKDRRDTTIRDVRVCWNAAVDLVLFHPARSRAVVLRRAAEATIPSLLPSLVKRLRYETNRA